MDLHLPTLLWLMTLTCAVLGASVLLVAWRMRAHRGLFWWGWGLLANGISYPVFGLRLAGVPEVSILGVNLLSALTLALHIVAIQQFQWGRAQAVPPAAIWAPVVLTVGAAIVWLHHDQIRNVVIGVLLAGLAALLAWQAWGPSLRGHRAAGRLLMVAGSVALAGILLVRLAVMATHGDWSGPLHVPAQAQAPTYLVVLTTLLLNTVGFLLMQMEHAVDEQHELATHDPLTGAANRRELMESIERSLSLARRSGQPMALLMIDIDFFKRVNDAHGHQIGDTVLREVARRVQARLRRHDLLARFGGEEFVVLLPGTDAAGARQLAESVRRSVADTPVAAGAHAIPLTISIGVHGRPGGQPPTPATADQMIAACDRAVYRAKDAGRNRVESET